MNSEILLSRLNQLPDYYQQELLDFYEFLLLKVKNTKNNSRGGYSSRKGDYIMSDDFNEPLVDFKKYIQ
jgi:hypothetical protein